MYMHINTCQKRELEGCVGIPSKSTWVAPLRSGPYVT